MSAPSPPAPFRHVACCIDDSDAGGAALSYAAMVAASTGGSLSIVHVLAPPPFLVSMAVGLGGAPVYDDGVHREAGQAWIEGIAATYENARAVLLEGHPGETACRWATDEGADLLVLASHRGRIERALLGSFASFVSHHAPCPVLLIPPAISDAN